MMELDLLEQELQRSIAIDFSPHPMVTLYFQLKQLSIETYENLHEKFGQDHLIMEINISESLDLSFTSKETGSTVNIKGLDFNKEDLDKFIEKTNRDQRFEFYTGFILERGEGKYPQSNLIAQQHNRLWISGYVVS